MEGATFTALAVGTDSGWLASSEEGLVYSIDSGGEVLWEYALGEDLASFTTDAAGNVYAMGWDKLYALGPDGGFRWSEPFGCCARLAQRTGKDGSIYVGTDDSMLYAFGPDGKKRWEFKTSGLNTIPAVGYDGAIYVGGDHNRLYAFNPDGKLRWVNRSTGDYYFSPQVDSRGNVYVCSSDGRLTAINSHGVLEWYCQTQNESIIHTAIAEGENIYAVSVDGAVFACDPL